MLRCPQASAPVVEDAGPPEAAAWVWLTILAILIVFELWATFKPPKTLSQWLRKWTRRFRWVRWLGIFALSFLLYHLFWF